MTRTRAGTFTVKIGDRVATVLRLSHQVGDTETLKAEPVVIGRAIVDMDNGERHHALLVTWDRATRVGGRLEHETCTGALYFNAKSGSFEIVEAQ